MEKVQYEACQTSGILLNANESPFPISEDIRKEMVEAISKIEFNRYPNDDATELRKAYADYLNVDEAMVMVGNGSDEMIGLIISLMIEKGKKVYTLDPDFSMYDYYTGMHGGEMVKYNYAKSHRFHVEEFIEYGREQNIDMILFSNPNNPTGAMISNQEILKILEAFPRCPVVIDEAYGEFAQESMLAHLEEYRNLIILRTMSKAFGAAALRCGFMITATETMKQLRPYKVPYNVNTLTQAFATILLGHKEKMKQQINEIILLRDEMYQQILDLHLSDVIIYPSQANYLYGQSEKKELFLQALANKDITIRNYTQDHTFRITIGTREQNNLVLETIKEVFQEQKELTI